MRILIDLQGAQSASRLRGIGRYSLSLAKAMIEMGRPRHEFYIMLNGMLPDSIPDIRESFEELLPRENILTWHAQGPTDWQDKANLPRRAAAQLIREAFIAWLAPDAVHVTSATDGYGDDATFSIGLFEPRPATAVTFYDAIPLVQRSVYLTPHPTYEAMYRERLSHVVLADALLAISEHARSEAVTHLQVAPEKTHNISADSEASFRKIHVRPWAARELGAKLGLNGSFIMYSGATDERKNHLRLLAAYSMLPARLRSNHQLLFVGRTPPHNVEKFRRYAKALGVSELEFIVCGTVTDDELLLLYNLCTLFVMPSWHEGFGLPALEAMRCGAPVIGANTTSIPELIADPSALFDPLSARSIAKKMEEVLSSPAALEALAQKGRSRARAFSWNRSAKSALAAIEALQPRKLVGFDRTVVDSLISRLGKALPPDTKEDFLRGLARDIDRTFVAPRQKQLLVDISELIRIDPGTGIQRVVNKILGALIASPPSGFLVVPIYAVHESSWYQYAREYAARALSLKGDFAAGDDDNLELYAGDVFLGLDLHHRTPAREMNISQRMREAGGYSYFVVYDLLPVRMPHYFPPAVPSRHMEWLRGVAESDGAICISRSVADEFIAWLPGSGSHRSKMKVGWFHLGFDIASAAMPARPEEDDDLLAAMGRRTSFLMVGTLEPRKGHLQTLIAFDELWDEGIDVNLVIVGKHGWNVDLQAELIRTHRELGHRLFWKESASDGLLGSIYEKAGCLIAASEGEGFGLPLVEAAAKGVHIIARDIAVFREVAGTCATFFQGDSGSSLATAARDWLERGNCGPAGGVASSSRITWRESKDQLMRCAVEGQWYWRGETSGDIRFVASDFRLLSVVGRRVGTSLHSTYQAGYLMFGHHLSLPPGNYAAELDVTFFAKGKYRLDAASDRAAKVLAVKERRSPPRGRATVAVTFKADAEVKDVEIRLHVDAALGIVLHTLSIRRLDLRVAYDEYSEPEPVGESLPALQ